MSATVAPEIFREAMQRTASGVTVVATDGPFGRAGVTVSSLCSLSLAPPSVLVCVHRNSPALNVLAGNGVFAANVLTAGQSRVADVFAGLVAEMREDRFAAGAWRQLVTGAPVLAGALCSFDCRVAATFDFGSHRILAGEVFAVATEAGEPLIYSGRAYRSLQAA
jgi:flavin reductase (DIM6/NTAB) family NADH-FMN oxidoreductase RutF